MIRARRADPDPESIWFRDHFQTAAAEVVEYARSSGVELTGRSIADVGCGDGIMALGVTALARPSELVGFDVNPVDCDSLLRRARAQRAVLSIPTELRFTVCAPDKLPAPSASFDHVYTWSAFEHISKPTDVLCEINRVLRPGGTLFLQLWPFFLSERGSHLWDWFSEPFHHLSVPNDELIAMITESSIGTPEWKSYMVNEFRNLNGITPGELQDSLLAAGFDIVRFQLLTNDVTVAPELVRRFRLTDLGTSGIKLLARRRGDEAGWP
jgi:ubiquinone/menaquinone biosynthesis C-methylase UbiE